MGNHPSGNTKYQISHMWEIHHKIKQLLVMGFKHVDIAETLGVSREMVSYTANSPIVQREIKEMRTAVDLGSIDVARRIQELATEAIEKLGDHMREGRDSISLNATKDILDRAGHGAIKKEAVLHGHLTNDDIEDIKRRGRAGGNGESTD